MRFSIGTKLIGLVTALLLISEAVIISLSTQLFLQDNSALVQQVNSQVASNLAAQLRIYLESYADRMKVIGEMWLQEQSHKPARRDRDHRESVALEVFRNEPDLLMAHLFENDAKGVPVSRAQFVADDGNLEPGTRAELLSPVLPLVTTSPTDRSPAEKPRQYLTAKFNQTSAMIFILPLSDGHHLAVWMGLSRIAQPLRSPEISSSVLVDGAGRVLVRSDGKTPAPTDLGISPGRRGGPRHRHGSPGSEGIRLGRAPALPRGAARHRRALSFVARRLLLLREY